MFTFHYFSEQIGLIEVRNVLVALLLTLRSALVTTVFSIRSRSTKHVFCNYTSLLYGLFLAKKALLESILRPHDAIALEVRTKLAVFRPLTASLSAPVPGAFTLSV